MNDLFERAWVRSDALKGVDASRTPIRPVRFAFGQGQRYDRSVVPRFRARPLRKRRSDGHDDSETFATLPKASVSERDFLGARGLTAVAMVHAGTARVLTPKRPAVLAVAREGLAPEGRASAMSASRVRSDVAHGDAPALAKASALDKVPVIVRKLGQLASRPGARRERAGEEGGHRGKILRAGPDIMSGREVCTPYDEGMAFGANRVRREPTGMDADRRAIRVGPLRSPRTPQVAIDRTEISGTKMDGGRGVPSLVPIATRRLDQVDIANLRPDFQRERENTGQEPRRIDPGQTPIRSGYDIEHARPNARVAMRRGGAGVDELSTPQYPGYSIGFQ